MSVLRRARCAAALTLLAVCLSPLTAAPATAAVGDPSYAGCIAGTPITGCTTAGPGLFAVDVELSPDGKQLYVLGREPSLRIYDLAASGAMVPRSGGGSCFNTDGANGCTATAGFTDFDVLDLAVSADGKSVYVSGFSNLVSWTRDPSTGNLTPSACYGPGAGCSGAFPRAAAVYAVVVSPDSKNVYVRQAGGLLVYDRNPTTGALTLKPGASGCLSELAVAGCTDSFGLTGNGFEMSLPADGQYLYLTFQDPGGVSVFNRAGDGTLTRYAGTNGGCISSDGSSTSAGECSSVGDSSGQAITNAWAATLSPSGKHVFVSGSVGTTVFARDAVTGKLTKTDCISPDVSSDCQQVSASDGMGVEVTPDGTRAIVGSNGVAGVGVYAFDEAAGTLSRLAGALGCFSATQQTGCTDLPGTFGGDGKAAISADGRNVYFAALTPVHRLVFDRVVKIVIRGQVVSLGRDARARVKLSCPATEQSGPCSGRLTLKTRGKVLFGGKRVVVKLASATYRVRAGTTKTVRLSLGQARIALVRRVPDARKLKVVATVKDTIGNTARVTKLATLRLP